MAGRPVWLASISRPSQLSRGRLATPLWSAETMAASWALLRRLVGPCGDPSRERIFRMQITTCLHRAASDDDLARVPAWFCSARPIDLAGGPVEILFETEPGLPSTHPCHNPTKIPLDPRNPLLWFPDDCGTCEPCLARAAHNGRLGLTDITADHVRAVTTRMDGGGM